MNYEILSIETTKKLESAKKIIEEIEKELKKGISVGISSGNRTNGKSILIGMRYEKDFILDKLKELKEKYGWK